MLDGMGATLQAHGPGISEAGDLEQGLDDLVGNGLVDRYGHNGRRAGGIAPDGHVANVDAVLAQNGPDLADHTRPVLVADKERVLFGNYVDREAQSLDDQRLHSRTEEGPTRNALPPVALRGEA